VHLPKTYLTKQAKDPFAYPFHGDWGGTYWIDTDEKKATKAAMKAGKTFPAVTVKDTRYKKD
jgi:microcin C transport system substrate-binding protein